MAIFPGEPWLASTFEAKDDGRGDDNWSYKTCKAPVKLLPSTNQHPAFYRPDDLPVFQPAVSKHWRGKSAQLHSEYKDPGQLDANGVLYRIYFYFYQWQPYDQQKFGEHGPKFLWQCESLEDLQGLNW